MIQSMITFQNDIGNREEEKLGDINGHSTILEIVSDQICFIKLFKSFFVGNHMVSAGRQQTTSTILKDSSWCR